MNDNIKNFIYSFTLTASNLIFSFITYPYVSRVLGVKNIGTCDYVDSIINYFVLLSTLGLGSYGIREIAKCKDDKAECSRVFSSLLVINMVMCIVAVCTVIACVTFIESLSSYKEFLYIGILKLVFNVFLIEWFYEGTSNFRYITIRSLSVKIVYATCVFTLVREQGDVLLYYLLTVCTVIVNALFNFAHSRKFVRFQLSKLSIRLLLLPILSFGVYRILSSLYNTFSTFYLGTITDSTQVGFFSTATKLYGILIMVFTALTTVLVPKVSELVGKKQQAALQEIANKTFDVIFILTLPVIIFCCFFAPQIIRLIAGPGYEGAILPFKIVIFLLFISAMQQVVVQQFLLAAQNSKSVLTLSTVGAISAVLLNMLFVPIYQCVGASVSLILSQLLVLLCGLYYFRHLMKLEIPYARMFRYLLASLPYALIGIMFQSDILSWRLAIPIALYMAWFFILNVGVIKTPMLIGLFRRNR